LICSSFPTYRPQYKSLDRLDKKDLHYSSVITASKADADQIKEIMVRAIESVRAVVKNSPDEEGYCYSLDFFGFRKS